MTDDATAETTDGRPSDRHRDAPRMHLRLDASYRRPADGPTVIGGSPLQLLTLSPGGVAIVRELEQTGSIELGTTATQRLIDRLIDLGIVHPSYDADRADAQSADPLAIDPMADPMADPLADPLVDPEGRIPTDRSPLTIVTPSFRAQPVLRAPPRGWSSRAIVVDDASTPPLQPSDVAQGAQIVRLEVNTGPGGARNAGLAEVMTEFVAFVDDDVEIDEHELTSLLVWFDDPRVALVAPRLRAPGAGSAPADQDRPIGSLARFELDRSPLDLGDQPARVAPTTRVSYVPAAVILCRTEALRSVGGFDTALRWGEDVDLVWRLHAAGWRCRYDPGVVAVHRTRSSLRAWVAQRFHYGESAAPLARRHPGALAPVRMSGWSAATWAPIAFGLPLVGVTIGLGTAIALVRKLPRVPAAESLRLAGLGNLYAGRLLAGALTRVWWPIALIAAIVSRRSRSVLLAAVVVPILIDRRAARTTPQARLDIARYAALHLLDDMAYGTGVWAGAWRERSFDALLPSFESWPPRDPKPH